MEFTIRDITAANPFNRCLSVTGEYVNELVNRPVSMGTLKPLSGVIKLTLPIETPVIHVQGGFKVPMETGRNLEHTTERHQRGFKVPMETGSVNE